MKMIELDGLAGDPLAPIANNLFCTKPYQRTGASVIFRSMTDRSSFLRVYDRWYWLLIPVLFLLIYHRVFTADYVYLDEAPQIHDRTGRQVYDMFMGQGRPLSAWVAKWGFTSVLEISALKWLRVISLTGWAITVLISSQLFGQWTVTFGWDKRIRLLADVFMIASLSVCIYIGWASCFQIFLAMLAAMLSAQCMVRYFFEQGQTGEATAHKENPGKATGKNYPGKAAAHKATRRKLVLSVAAILLALGSLFTYQTGYGLFLLPFLLQYVAKGATRPSRELQRALVFYLGMYVLYYILLKGMIPFTGIPMSERAGFTSSPFGKLGFLFSGPLPSAFSLNLLYSSGVLPVQIFQYLIMAIWLFLLGKSAKEPVLSSRIVRVALALGLISLVYLPSMIAKENFASYRSLFPVALVVFLSFAMLIMQAVAAVKWKNTLMISLLLLVAGSGAWSYDRQLVSPLVSEYDWYQTQIAETPSPGSVVLVRADRQLFRNSDHIRAYKDEFGCPSTSRDWVPVPMIRQLIVEQSKRKENITAGSAAANADIMDIPLIQFDQHDSIRLRHTIDSLNTSPQRTKVLLLNINQAWQKP